jgi:tetratricopeptide (TPR) repeat protein
MQRTTAYLTNIAPWFALAATLSFSACRRDTSTIQGNEMRTALGDLASAEDVYYATNLRYSADQSLIVGLTLPDGVKLSVERADEHGWRASASHEHGDETCFETGRNDGTAALAVVEGPTCNPLHVSATLRDVRGRAITSGAAATENAETIDDQPAQPQTPVTPVVASNASTTPMPAGTSSVLLPAVNPAEDFGYPTQTVNRLAIRQLLLNKSYDVLDRVLAAYADSVLRDFRVEYRLFDAYAAFDIAVPSLEPRLTEWVKQRPKSPAARLARAMFFRASAWNARGGALYRETPRDQIQRMNKFFTLSLADIDAALRLEPKSIVAYRQLIDLAREQGDVRASQRFLQEGLKLQPNSFVLRMGHMLVLLPRWGGSYKAMNAFVDESAPYVKTNPRIAALGGFVDWDQGRVAERAGRDGDAIEAYQRALQYGNLWEFRYQRAAYNSRSDRLEDALADLNSVLAQVPQFADALSERSHVTYELGRQASGDASASYYRQAFRDIMLAAALDPTDEDIQERLAFMGKNIPDYAPPNPE